MDLIDKLNEEQRKNARPSAEMAAALFSSRRYYDKLIARHRRPGARPLAGIIQNLPHLAPFVLAYLASWRPLPPHEEP